MKIRKRRTLRAFVRTNEEIDMAINYLIDCYEHTMKIFPKLIKKTVQMNNQEEPWVITVFISAKNKKRFVLTKYTENGYETENILKKISTQLEIDFENNLLGKYTRINFVANKQQMLRFIDIDSYEYIKKIKNSLNLK